jgi:chemotaxis protein MotB
MGDMDQLSAAQNHARELYAENQNLLAAQMQNQQQAMGLDAERQALMQKVMDAESQLANANSRVENLMAERKELNDRYAKNLTDDGSTLVGGSPANTALEADGFQFDPATGLNKFRSDVLFDLGSDILRPEAEPILSEFASTVKSGAASGLRILIVGHTDDQRIARRETAAKHPTNWHLSTDRSAAVILALSKMGVPPERMASMGYSEFQPLENSTADAARQRNRRVELYVVPNNDNMAKWDPATSVR